MVFNEKKKNTLLLFFWFISRVRGFMVHGALRLG